MTRDDNSQEGHCHQCGRDMVPGYASQFYCSQECQQSWQGQAIGAIQLETITVYFSDQETLF